MEQLWFRLWTSTDHRVGSSITTPSWFEVFLCSELQIAPDDQVSTLVVRCQPVCLFVCVNKCQRVTHRELKCYTRANQQTNQPTNY